MIRRLVLTALCLLAATVAARAAPPEPPVVSHALTGGTAGTILGREVLGSDGGEIGQFVDVLVDKDGNALAGVIDVGGFLGVGTRRIAVAWHLLRFVQDKDGTHVVVGLTLDTAAGAPEYLGPENTLIVIDRASP